MNKEVVMTYAGLRALEDELENLKTVKRKEVAEKIKVARGYGDLSENSEYDEAKNEQGMIESRIAELEKRLKHARVIDGSELTNESVSVGSHVKIRDEDGDEDEYDITGSTEADPLAGKISDESPIGAALIGHSAGERVDVTLPNGSTVVYEIVEISVSASCRGKLQKIFENRCESACFCVTIGYWYKPGAFAGHPAQAQRGGAPCAAAKQ